MLSVDWKTQALDDLATIYVYIEQYNPQAATSLRDYIIACSEKLPQMPYMFRRGRIAGTREYVVHPNYILVYEVRESTIDIVRVLHAKQEYPKT